MEVSNENQLFGEELLEEVIALAGLPKVWIQSELEPIIQQKGLSSQNLTMEQFREIMLAYLESVQVDFK